MANYATLTLTDPGGKLPDRQDDQDGLDDWGSEPALPAAAGQPGRRSLEALSRGTASCATAAVEYATR